MNKKYFWKGLTTGLILLALQGSSLAGARLDIDEDSYLDLGLRVQALGISSEKDLAGDGTYESYDDFKVRRARFRLKGVVNEYLSAFLQTDVGSAADGSGQDTRVIDAFLTLKKDASLQLVAGMNMAPASRQNLTSSGALMAMDRPGITYKSLTWGTRAVTTFANATYADTDAGLRGDVDVRDTGMTLFGHLSDDDQLHWKYYLGAYDGIQETTEDNLRYAGRLQVNIGDAESGYYNSSTYLGAKKTIGLGVSYDMQSAVAGSADQGNVDYTFYSVDAFMEQPVGEGSLTAEAGYTSLDLDDAMFFDHDGDVLTAAKNALQSQGDGFYVQAGYYVNQWQPWVEWETFDSDASTGKGSYDLYRVGVSYFLKGQNANIKGGYEHFEADAPIGTSVETELNSVVVGLYMTY